MIDVRSISDLSDNAKKRIFKDTDIFMKSFERKEVFEECYIRHDKYLIQNKNLPYDREQFQKAFKAKNFFKDLKDCGSWLEFRWYVQSDTTKLHTANFCKRDKLCPACAVRRAYKQQIKFLKILEQDSDLKSLDWYYIVIPVKHESKESFETVFDRLETVRRKITKSLRNSRSGKGNNIWSSFTGGMYSTETTHTKNGWNVHLNLIINAPKGTKLALREYKQVYKGKEKIWYENSGVSDWLLQKATGSHIHSIQKIDFTSDDLIRSALVEVLKYSLKFSSLTNQQLLEVFIKTRAKRLFGVFGNLWGVGIDDVVLEGDELVDNEFQELIFTRSGYEYILYKREIKIVDKD